MSNWVTNGGAPASHSPRIRNGGHSLQVREIQASGVSVRRGEVLVPTQLGDDLHGLIECPAAPLVAGSLQRRASQVRLAPVPNSSDPLAVTDAIVFAATCPQRDGGTAGIAAATAPEDKRAAAFAYAAVEEWAAVAENRMLLVAGRPWCSGALQAAAACRDAAEHAADGKRVLLFEPRAIPPESVTELAELGTVPVAALTDSQPGDTVVFPAHGVRPEVRAEAVERGLAVVDATCPVVARAQEAAARLAAKGQHLVLIGPPDAAAAGPIISRAAGHVTVVESVSGTASMQVTDAQRIAYMVQPGLPAEAADGVVDALRSRYPAARSTQPEGLCYAASDRAATVHAIAVGSDVVLVLGNAQSADARQLAGQAREAGARVQPIAAVSDITPAMLAGASTVGIVESLSATTALTAEAVAAISGLGRVTVARRQVSTELAGGAT